MEKKLPRRRREDEAESSGNLSAQTWTDSQSAERSSESSGLCWSTDPVGLYRVIKWISSRSLNLSQAPWKKTTSAFLPWHSFVWTIASIRQAALADRVHAESGAASKELCGGCAASDLVRSMKEEQGESTPTRMCPAMQSYACGFIARANTPAAETCISSRIFKVVLSLAVLCHHHLNWMDGNSFHRSSTHRNTYWGSVLCSLTAAVALTHTFTTFTASNLNFEHIVYKKGGSAKIAYVRDLKTKGKTQST